MMFTYSSTLFHMYMIMMFTYSTLATQVSQHNRLSLSLAIFILAVSQEEGLTHTYTQSCALLD